MVTVVPMPKLGAGVFEEARVSRWLKNEGEMVMSGEKLVELETDKAIVEYESPSSGVLLKKSVQEGDSVSIGNPLCVLGEAGERLPTTERAKTQVSAQRADVYLPSTSEISPLGKISPAAARLAENLGVKLENVTGMGPGGMIMRDDVLRAARASRGVTTQAKENEVPMSTMRLVIAQRLLKSQQETAHVTLTREIEASELVSFVKELDKESNISYTDVLVKVVAEALTKHPMMNSKLEGDRIRILPDINVGVAVAVEGGLVTPTIRKADRVSVAEISRELKELSEKAKLRKLDSADYTDGTFTLSNLGMFGVDAFTPIINPPQVGILGAGRILERPWVENGQIKITPTMFLSLTFDHRVVDGVDGARFLATVASLLSDLSWLN